MDIRDLKRKYIDGYDKRVKKQKGKKSKREMLELSHHMLNVMQNSSYYREYGASYMLMTNLFEQEKRETSVFDKLRFNGSWADDDAVALYELQLHEEMMAEQVPGNRYQTYGDLALNQFFKTAEENGINVLELRRRMGQDEETINARQSKRERKENKKKESALIQRITELSKSKKFKRLVKKAENALNNYQQNGLDD